MHSEIQTETRKIIQEETPKIVGKIIQEDSPKIVEIQIAPLKKQIASLSSLLKSEIHKVRKDINMVIRMFDNDYFDLRIRVEKIEDDLHLSHN